MHICPDWAEPPWFADVKDLINYPIHVQLGSPAARRMGSTGRGRGEVAWSHSLNIRSHEVVPVEYGIRNEFEHWAGATHMPMHMVGPVV